LQIVGRAGFEVVAGAGRSSSPALTYVLRRISAVMLAASFWPLKYYGIEIFGL
jgi:hypothetical protein